MHDDLWPRLSQHWPNSVVLPVHSCVVEVAAKDGHLFQYVRARGIPCYGIEPTASTAAAARKKNIVEDFFSLGLAETLASARRQADLIAANNGLARVPDINDFVGGFARLLKLTGVATSKSLHVYRLVAETRFDTIYQEHYSYLSLTAVYTVFAANGLVVFDVETLVTHGSSLRVFAHRAGRGGRRPSERVAGLAEREQKVGMTTRECYQSFQGRVNRQKNDFLGFLLEAKRQGLKVADYGAAPKGNTLLNYAGVRSDLLPCVVDRNRAKQVNFLPGSRIPIGAEEHLQTGRPDRVVILLWNLKEEIVEQLVGVRDWGGMFVISAPVLAVQ
jgi:hypothetical protein